MRLQAGMMGSPSVRPQASAGRATPAKLTGAIRSRRSVAAAPSDASVPHHSNTTGSNKLLMASKMNKDRPSSATDRTGAAAAAALAALMLTAQPSIAADAASTFANRCAGCHAGGGNVVQVSSNWHGTLTSRDTRSALWILPDTSMSSHLIPQLPSFTSAIMLQS